MTPSHDRLRDCVFRHAQQHADADGIARTPLEGVCAIQASAPSEILYAIPRPLICLVLQGSKQVAMGEHSYRFSAGDTLLITADVPTISQVTQASAQAPYLSLVIDLDLALLAELALQMQAALPPAGEHGAVVVEPTDADVAQAALQIMDLLERPAALAVLQQARLRELHYWLLAGRHGAALRRLGVPDGQVQRIARAVALLRADPARPMRVEQLAQAANMSASSFHQHFRAVTSLSPLQFQKQLRLIEARRLMMAQGLQASAAAFAVGYESVSQFTREYRRMFGLPPGQDKQAVRRAA